jgi:hydroxyisourate hydrolase
MAAVPSVGQLTTHVLDVARGRPAEGVAIELVRPAGPAVETFVARAVTNADGRTDAPLVAAGSLEVGLYELRFAIGPYFAAAAALSGDVAVVDPPFLDIVPVRFGIVDANVDFHVPLLCTPWSYSTYRGS